MDQIEGAFDVFDLVGEDLDLEAFGGEEIALQPFDHLVHLARDLEHVRARFAREQHHHGGPVLNEGHARGFAKRHSHRGHIAEHDGGSVRSSAEDDLLEGGGVLRCDRGPHEVAPLSEGHVAAREITKLASNALGDARHRQPAAGEGLRVEEHVDLAVLTSDEANACHAWDSVDLR